MSACTVNPKPAGSISLSICLASPLPAPLAPSPHPLLQEDNVWTGHLKGTVRVRPKHKWEWKTEEQAFSTTIRVSCGTAGPDQ